MKKMLMVLIVPLLLAIAMPAIAKEPAKSTPPKETKGSVDWETIGTDFDKTGWMEWQYSYDTRDRNHWRMDAGVNLPYRITYFGFFYLDTNINADNSDSTAHHSEHDIWWNPVESIPVDTAFQWALNSVANDLFRFGARWRISDTSFVKDFCDFAHIYLTTQIHALQTDFSDSAGWGFGFEHFWIWNILPEILGDDRLKMVGFIDHNMNWGGGSSVTNNHHDIVFEDSLKIRTISKLYIVSDLVYSDYDVEDFGVRFGLQYTIPF